MSKAQKVLLCWSGALVAGAAILARVPLGEQASIIAGATEVVLAILTGLAFGLTVSWEKE